MNDTNTSTSSQQQLLWALTPLQSHLIAANSIEERISTLKSYPFVHGFLSVHPSINSFIESTSKDHATIILQIIAIGQGDNVLRYPEHSEEYHTQLTELAERLRPADQFYDSIGGLVGYHVVVLRLLLGEDLGPFVSSSQVCYKVPEGIDIRQSTPEIARVVLHAIEKLDRLAEIYVVGGAGDRLDLRDPISGAALPAAMLAFEGRSLLEGLIRDLQAREYLHYKLFHKQLVTPIAMMTSEEKDNHRQILAICESNRWWGRPRDSFKLFSQPGGPVVAVTGDWSLKAPLTPTLKPGGHGVLWKLALDSGVFDWLEDKGCSKLLIRQINNPVASVDFGLLAFLGFGLMGDKAFGMASCDRLLNRPEGMSVLIETRETEGYDYRLSNVEYTEFAKRGIHDAPVHTDSECSVYPANTNILFADIRTVRDVIPRCPLPGLLINAKTMTPILTTDGVIREVPGGRLETTMQNIADYICDHFSTPLPPGGQHQLRTFATYNVRRKTLSTTKSTFVPGKSAVGSPEGTFFDVLTNYRELFTEHCHFTLPALEDYEKDLLAPPPFLIQLHPAIGPLFSIIAQKIQGGSLAPRSELRLEIAEIEIRDLHLAGSLIVTCDQVTGLQAPQSMYNEQCGKCSLQRVNISNKGIANDRSGAFWRGDIAHQEMLKIVLHGNGEFHAADVTFRGNQTIEVADGERLEAKARPDGGVIFVRTKITHPTWDWHYRAGTDGTVTLTKRPCSPFRAEFRPGEGPQISEPTTRE